MRHKSMYQNSVAISKWYWLLIFVFAASSLLRAQEFNRVYHSISEAKAVALVNNRPLLVVLGSAICPHCDNFDNRVFNTDAFLAYAAAKRIVLYHQRDDGSLRRQVMRDYQRKAGMETVLPVIFMFKVRAGADLTSDDSTALIPTQVD
ncbi:MAG: hypothetical protein GX946_06005, partial [Oligosphaeraceae bacterium]|nr:hypothetical protein [Oligosphaeraceae bacterium]